MLPERLSPMLPLVEGREVSIRMKHLKLAQSEMRPTTLEWLSTARNYARYANEAGQYDEVLAFPKFDPSGNHL